MRSNQVSPSGASGSSSGGKSLAFATYLSCIILGTLVGVLIRRRLQKDDQPDSPPPTNATSTGSEIPEEGNDPDNSVYILAAALLLMLTAGATATFSQGGVYKLLGRGYRSGEADLEKGVSKVMIENGPSLRVP